MTRNRKPSSPIVIVGCQRSGTTLLRTMLGNHPAILEHPDEPQFILGLYQRFGFEIRDVREAIEYVAGHPYFPKSLSREALESALRPLNPISLADFMDTYLAVWAGDAIHGKQVLLKHPHLVFSLGLVQRVFRDPIVIHILRDPRANVLSQRTRWPQFSIWECAMLWRNAVRSARRWAERTDEQYLEVRYEDLVHQPGVILGRLTSDLCLSFTPRMLDFRQETTLFSDAGTPSQVTLTSPDPTRTHRWQEMLSDDEIYRIEQCCRQEMGWWDYPLSDPEGTKKPGTALLLAEMADYKYKNLGRKAMAQVRIIGWRTGLISKIE